MQLSDSKENSVKKVVVLIPIHNGLEDTLICLESLKKSTYSFMDIIVIDDGSTDKSQEVINNNFSDIKFINGNGNLWWSGGMNEGIKHVLGSNYHLEDLVVLLNNDNIVDIDTIEKLVSSSQTHSNSIISSKVYLKEDEKKILFAGGYSSIKKGGLYIRGFYEKEEDQYNETMSIEWCGGMSVAIPISIIKDVGMFDNQNFPQYFGDADYIFRARKKGYKVIYDPSCICWNNKEQTGYSIKNEKITMEKVKRTLFDIKSNYQIKTNLKFYLKHFGVSKGMLILLTRYSILFMSLTKKTLF